MARLPEVGGDSGSWGQLLNDYLQVSHNADGTLKNGAVSGASLADNSINVAKIATSSAPSTNQALTYNGTGLAWTTLSGGGSVPDASASTKGVIQLTGDLGGTAAAPTVPGLAAKADASALAAKADVSALNAKANTADLAPVATSGSYTDLTNKPTIPTIPVTSVAGRTGAITLTSTDVGLGNVNNTSDANKPISTATQTALDGKAASTHGHDAADITSGTIASVRLPLATDTVPGAIELATVAEAQTGTDTSRAVTPAGLKTVVDAVIQPKVIFVDTLGDIPNGTPADTLVVVRAA